MHIRVFFFVQHFCSMCIWMFLLTKEWRHKSKVKHHQHGLLHPVNTLNSYFTIHFCASRHRALLTSWPGNIVIKLIFPFCDAAPLDNSNVSGLQCMCEKSFRYQTGKSRALVWEDQSVSLGSFDLGCIWFIFWHQSLLSLCFLFASFSPSCACVHLYLSVLQLHLQYKSLVCQAFTVNYLHLPKN